MRKLLIADSNEDFRLALSEALQNRCQILWCSTGTEALRILREETPEILILELMLPELDGLTLLERANAEGLHPSALAVTSLVSDYVMRSAEAVGISYVMRKPCDIRAVADRALDLPPRTAAPVVLRDDRHLVSDLLLKLRISTKHKGYRYLLEGILVIAQDPAQSITKELYAEVAKRCGCKRQNVERPMRNALESAWQKGDQMLWAQYFPEKTNRPTNAEFLSRMAQELKQNPE